MARLSAFYGIDPWRLIAELPLRIVRGLSRQLPTLQAERSFSAADEIGVGVNFAFTEGHGKAVIDRWRNDLGVKAPRPRSATPELLQGLGIALKKVPKIGAVSDACK